MVSTRAFSLSRWAWLGCGASGQEGHVAPGPTIWLEESPPLGTGTPFLKRYHPSYAPSLRIMANKTLLGVSYVANTVLKHFSYIN